MQTVTLDLTVQDIDAQLLVGLLQLGYQAARETGEQSVVHTFKIYRGTVGCQDDTLAVTEQVVEDMEEGILCLGGRHPLLDIIHDQDINRLIESDEVVDLIL